MKRLVVFSLIIALVQCAPKKQVVDNKQPEKKDDPVLMTVNGKSVSRSEFEAIFRKNNHDSLITRASLDEYVKLFTNFKLKVAEAEELGMDTLKKFNEELAGYRKQLAKPYLVDNNLNEELLAEAYERMKTEVRASHLLILCAQDAFPEDTLKAWKKIMEFREKIMKSGDFGAVAAVSSEDPSASKNKGDLGYFTSLQMVYPFETACYKLKVGEVSMPVRTRFGYHLVKVTDRRPARGTIRCAHILIASKEDDPKEKQDKARQTAEELLQKIKAGEDFATLARQFSDDQSSKVKGGELPWFGPGRMVEEFENAAFALKNDGDVTEVVKSAYGYHIIKRLELKTIDTFDKMKGELKMRIGRDSRSYLPQASFVNKLKKKYNLKQDPKFEKSMQELVARIDSTVFQGKWEISKASGLSKTLAAFDGKKITQADLASYIEKNQRREKNQDINQYVRGLYDRMLNDELLNYEDSRLEQQYTDFRLLMKEYRDGILLFDLTDKKVWSKAVKDTAGLREFYEAHKTSYMHPRRYEVEMYVCKDGDLASDVLRDLKAGKLTEQALEDKYNKESRLNLRTEKGIFSAEDKTVLQQVKTDSKDFQGPFMVDGQACIVKVNRVVEPAPKELSEAKGPVTSDYQDYLEQEWLTSLRNKYKVVVNQDVLYSIK